MSVKKVTKSDAKANNKAVRHPAAPKVRPTDDPIAALSAARQPNYQFSFDVSGLNDDVTRGPSREMAAEVFAGEVQQNMQADSIMRIVGIDPAFLTTIIQVVLSIVGKCAPESVRQALTECEAHPRSLRARYTKLALARRLPGHWLHDSLEVARAMVDTGIKNMGTDLFFAFFPNEATGAEAPAVDPALPQ